ncbi:hypothetical protein [Microbacterium sp. Leaf151]|uniref:hypothetical protein n=1 Tax=Microbacterium sp. Leaf151 TaxID=1736276 RepID=UPI0006FAA684|nr:hypothetical protein [Microbacterium sp. Leaf151]KQR25347.1 hypothetical protein ASF76_06875 [Microbacterium sp. Leaf151]
MRIRAFAAAATLAASATLAGCVPPDVVCPAIMYINVGPVVIEADPDLVGDGSLAACLGRDCDPAPVASAKPGVWNVPPEPPYAPADNDGVHPTEGVRVVIMDSAGETVRDEWLPVPYVEDAPGPCPSPFTLRPVVIGR